jgi:hypothetical protein
VLLLGNEPRLLGRPCRSVVYLGRAVAQAVSCRLPSAEAGFDPRPVDVGFVVDNVLFGQVFSEYFGFPCQFSSHRLLHTHYLSSVVGTIGQIVAVVISGLSVTHPKELVSLPTEFSWLLKFI